jgi:hypothetical protein
MEDVTIILQGPINTGQLRKWIENYKEWNIIISTWGNQQLELITFPPKWIVLIFPISERTIDIGNLEYQILSTVRGFPYVQTQFLIKGRCDEYFSNLHRFVRELKYKKDQIICSDIFYRGLESDTFFHISDHLIGGTTPNVKAMFENTYNQIKDGWKIDSSIIVTGIPESYLGFGFVSYKEDIDKNSHQEFFTHEKSHPLFEKWFDSYDINKLFPYVISCRKIEYSSRYNCLANF